MTEAAVRDIERRAASLRRHVIRQAAGKGEGYVGQGMQSADIFAALFFNEMNWSGQRLDDPERDRFLLSVGHYAIALYAVLAEAGALSQEQLSTYGADGSHLTLGAEPGDVPGVEFAGGSLGQGLGVAAGLAWGLRSTGSRSRVFNYMSDGELQEGAVWRRRCSLLMPGSPTWSTSSTSTGRRRTGRWSSRSSRWPRSSGRSGGMPTTSTVTTYRRC